MGRRNNAKAQAAAAALKNTPARARFSKGPPNASRNTRGKRRGDGGAEGNGATGGGRGRGGRGAGGRGGQGTRRNTEATARVIDKIQNRVQQQESGQRHHHQQQPTGRVASATEALQHVDASKLDEIVITPTTQDLISKLLEDLGIVSTGNSSLDKTTNPSSSSSSRRNLSSEQEDMVDEMELYDPLLEASNARRGTTNDYTVISHNVDDVYNDDFDDTYYEHGDYPDGHDDDVDDDDDDDESGSEASETESKIDEGDGSSGDDEKIEESHTFIHFTQHLSFTYDQAKRVCSAIDGWEGLTAAAATDGDLTVKKKSSEENNESTSSQSNTSDERLQEIAMDWLCLHLTEDELAKGFRPNPNPPTKKVVGDKKSRPVIKAISHPSISVISNPLLEAKEWAKSEKLQKRALVFTRLGFHHSDAIAACNANTMEESNEPSAPQKVPLDDPAISSLMRKLRDEALVGMSAELDIYESSLVDNDVTTEERRNELEALQAIYDDQIEILYDDDQRSVDETTGGDVDIGTEPSRYCLNIVPSEELAPPANTSESKLFIFLQPGYPATETPLFLFVNTGLPPSLLRRINLMLHQKSFEILGTPVVFEIVSFICDSLAEWQMDFIKEQRRKEFDAEQTRLSRQREVQAQKLEDVVAAQYELADSGGTLGRRQKAKLKAAEKAFNQPDNLARLEEERKKRQAARIEEAKHQISQTRSQYAQDAVMKREMERIEEEAERAARAAMNKAFNNGQSREEARAAAESARNEILRYHFDDDEENIQEDKEHLESQSDDESCTNNSSKDSPESSKISEVAKIPANESQGPTQTTSAFMDRLREMYEKAAQKKAGSSEVQDDEREEASENENNPCSKLEGYHLDTNLPSREHDPDHIPRPVAVPGGELATVMKDIITQQEEQPWLIADEARAPTTTVARKYVSDKETKLERNISEKLRSELDRKRLEARKWGQRMDKDGKSSQPTKTKTNNGFSPEKFYHMMSARERLPAYQQADDIVSTINANQVTVIAGETGCGKTTQVPQLVLDHLIESNCGAAANIIVTQPRRISAIGVSDRIAQERCEKVGETCGYSIKLEKKMSRKTRLLLCTTGVLLRRLQVDPDLASVSHIFVDEVHERDLNTDFLIIILKDLLARRKNLKLVLMSATLNAESFQSYFKGCPIVSIPGRAHPVQENRLEDILELTGYQVEEGSDYALKTSNSEPPKISKSVLRRLYHPKYSKSTIHSLSIIDETVICYPLLAELLENISINKGDGAILVFVPGFAEIQKTIEELYKKEYFQSSEVVIYPLHSSLSTAEQTAIFEVPPPGVRKIVVSTNISETSITIEDVVFVVDTGRVKENRRDEVNETPTLVECWVSRASAKQRRGRAGRVKPGVSYHLFSSHTHDNDMLEYQLPEMLRVGIEDLVLQILVLDLGEPTTFLRKALDPPTNLALSNSLRLLEQLGAVDVTWQSTGIQKNDINDAEFQASSELTALGFHLAAIPVDPRVGKCLIYASLFGCVDPLLTLAATMSSRSPFLSPFDQRDQADEARKNFAVEGSDHLTILQAFDQWTELRQKGKGNKAVNEFLKENFLGRLTLHQMEDLRKQYHSLLVQIGFLPSKFRLKDKNHPGNMHSKNLGLVKAVLCAGLYPGVIIAPRDVTSLNSKTKVGEKAFRSHTKGDVYLHPSTIAFDMTRLDSRYCCFHELVRTSKTYVRDCTPISPLSLILFGGALTVNQSVGVASVDGWLRFRISAKHATLMKYLRGKMEQVLFDKIVDPEKDISESPDSRAVIESICLLFEAESKAQPDRSAANIVRPWTGREDEDGRSGMNVDHNRGRGGRGRGRGRGRGGRGRGGRGGRGRGRS